ncbi:MAG: DUF1570 domain-containing protein [Planctomycetaceae bacterium]|nr:DUF1570 domain-containing protein [Planctomycetaceae bacterium]
MAISSSFAIVPPIMPQRMIHLCLAFSFGALTFLGVAEAAESRQLEQLKARHATLRRDYAETLASLAHDLEAVGAIDAAGEAWKLAVPPNPREIVVTRLPSQVQPEVPHDVPAEERALRLKLRKAREQQSTELYQLSRQALSPPTRSVQLAFELLRESAVQNPDNAIARKVLGFVRAGDEWLTPFERRKRQAGEVWHDRYGWLPKDHVQRYEAGERNYEGRWITAENEAELRRDFDNCWEVRTEHYLVKTNHSLERGVEVASRLEVFHDFFMETFAGFFSGPEDLKSLFGGGTSRATSRSPYEIHYYRDRNEYNQKLVVEFPVIGITNGLYFTKDRVAYFFHDPTLTLDDTLYHEATHQLMYECLPRQREVATQAHFWVIEGIACYMESFRPGEGLVSLGNVNHDRIRAAQYRYEDGYYVPLGQFAAKGLHQFQSEPSNVLQKNYSQAAGLSHFFMHYDDGRYRDALVEHLSQLYHGVGAARRPVQNLAVLTGVAYTTLDRQYGEYMKSLAAPAATSAARE